jgi:Fe-S oxidoreductase
MFSSHTCKRCGACLAACPFLAMPLDEARQEIAWMIDTRTSEKIESSCAGCSYCDTICPTQSHPSDLRKDILQGKNRKIGVSGLRMMSDDIPFSIMTAGLETDKENKLARLQVLTHPDPCCEVFHLGCSLSYIYTDLAQSALFSGRPVIGGMKYCCGAYAYHLFGEQEARIQGRKLLAELKKIGVRKIITFCPECHTMLGQVYPSLIEEFDFSVVSVADDLLERCQSGHLTFVRPIAASVALADSCAWRKMGPEVYESPRRLLRAMGADVVELEHNRRQSICCGTPLLGRNSPLAATSAEKRVLEAKAAGARILAVSCTGCFNLSQPVLRHGLTVYHLTELAQMAVGETPPHRIEETKTRLAKNIFAKMNSDPEVLQRKYILQDGVIKPRQP